MLAPSLIVLVAMTAPAPGAGEAHGANAVYKSLREEGLDVEGRRFLLPAPSLEDGQGAEAQKAALRKVVGSERALAEFLRDSVSAPHILKLSDEQAPGSVVRRADLWFAIRADLDAIDPDAAARRLSEAPTVEAANMRFTSRLVAAGDLASRGIQEPPTAPDLRTWYLHMTGRLLDRIQIEATDRTMATRSPESWLIAARTDRRFDRDATLANRWWPITRKGARDDPGPAQRFDGGANYVKIVRLASEPGVLVAEAHFAFAEPRAWFDGAPILRSKIGVIAQDQIRRLRRDLAEARTKAAPKPRER